MRSKKPLVIDSSVAVRWLNKEGGNYTAQADKILKDVQEEKIYLVMPELAKYEIGNALLCKQTPIQNALGSVATYYSIPISFIPQDQQQARSTMQIAYENKVTFYDASFMALAKDQKTDLVTDNPKHQKRKVKGFRVVSLKDY